jgi:two-component system, sensor histidine kinase and response regulator
VNEERVAPGARSNILVIDDEAAIREVVTRLLEQEGYGVAAAPDAENALAMIAQQHFDAVITDVRMPGGSGLDLLSELKRNNPNCVVVVMTGYADMDTVLAALRADADDFVIKPVNVPALAAVLRRAIDRRELKADLAGLRRQTKARDRFLSFVSHKLNTPLTSVLLFLDSLGEESSLDAQLALLRDGLPDATAAAAELRDLIAELLRVAETLDDSNATPVGLEPVSLIPVEPLLAELAVDAREAAAARGITVTLDPSGLEGLALRAARERVWRALRELVDNAVKFNRDGGEVWIEAGRGSAETEVEVRVRDTGPGIPEAELPKAFEPFQQVDPGFTGQVPGFGLGLALARRLLDVDGGRLVLTSSPAGTVATVTLPSA